MSHDVLGDGDGVRKVDDSMPQSSRHEHGLPRPLNELPDLQLLSRILLLYFGQNLNKVVDGFVFVVGSSELFALHDCFGYALSKQDPSFVASQRGIPGGGMERVDVDCSA